MICCYLWLGELGQLILSRRLAPAVEYMFLRLPQIVHCTHESPLRCVMPADRHLQAVMATLRTGSRFRKKRGTSSVEVSLALCM